MDKYQAMAKVLAAIEGGKGKPVFNLALVSERVLGMPEKERDEAALLLQENGYIKGLEIIDGIDGQRVPYIYWQGSYPAITMKGYDYIEENKPLKSALKALREAALPVAAQIVANVIEQFGK